MSSSDESPAAGWLAGAEALTVFALIVAYIWWLRFRFPYCWVAILALVFSSHILRRETWRQLGFVWNGAAFGRPVAALAAVGVVFLAIGVLFRSFREVSLAGAASSFAVYLVWGFFQQYLLNAYFMNRFLIYLRSPARAAAGTVIFFSAAHMPNWFLMLAAFAGGYVCARIFVKYRSLYFLGLAHAVVGFLIYLVAPDSLTHHLYVGPKWFTV